MLLPLILVYLVVNVFAVTTVIDDSLELTGSESIGFGSCVRMNDNVVVVGSPLDDENGVTDVGSVTIFYTREGNVVREKITRNETRNAGDNIGYSLALSGNFLVVSSLHGDGRQTAGNEGAVYVHKYNGNDWSSSVQKIFADDGTTNAEFGSSVGIHANILVVGARYDNAEGDKSGSAYVFTYNGLVWTQTQKLIPNDLSSDDRVGGCVAISNRYIVLGGRRCVYIFKIDYQGIWVEQTKLNPPNFIDSSFGNNLDIYESRIIIGADNGGRSEGKAYVYSHYSGEWALEATLTASDGTAGNYFGFSVSIDKHTVVIGAHNSTNNRALNSGSAYAYELISGNWTEAAKFISRAHNTGGYFGMSVDVLNGTAVVGRSDNNGNATVYVFAVLRNFVVECTELYVRGIWRRGQFPGRIGVTLNDPSCNQFSEGNFTHVWIKSFFADCGSMTQHENVIIHSNMARLTVASLKLNTIERETEYKFNMHCEFDRSKYTAVKQSYNINIPDPVFPPIKNKTEVPVEDFNATIALYTNQYFVEEAFSPVTVATGEPIYIGISEQTANLKYKFTVHECTATPMANTLSSFTFFYQGCPVDSNAMNIIIANATHFQFQINTFRFISLSREVYIHCLVYVCMASSTAPGCVQTCSDTSGRKRRSNESPLKEVIVTTPLITFKQKDTCNETKCPEHSTCVNLFPALCRCNDGYVEIMDTDPMICDNGIVVVDGKEEKRMTTITGIAIDKPFVKAYEDTNSDDFQKLARDVEQQLSYYIRLYNDPSIIGIKVVAARRGSIILDIVIIRGANVTEEKVLDTFIGAIITNRTELVDSAEMTNVTRPSFLGNFITIMDNKMPVLATDESTVDTDDDNERTILIAVLVPALAVLMICFIVFVVVIHRRTQTHYLFE